jgi:hypothetical protein
MRHLRKTQRNERAHQYRVIANRLGFHIEAGHHRLEPEVLSCIETARDALVRAADLLDHEEGAFQKRAS